MIAEKPLGFQKAALASDQQRVAEGGNKQHRYVGYVAAPVQWR